jgi:hypothetical protein
MGATASSFLPAASVVAVLLFIYIQGYIALARSSIIGKREKGLKRYGCFIFLLLELNHLFQTDQLINASRIVVKHGELPFWAVGGHGGTVGGHKFCVVGPKFFDWKI